jgi:hypothetical protein
MKRETARCNITEDGFAISHTESGIVHTTVRWEDVREVLAFKRDLSSNDMICLAFQLADGSRVEICEEDEGFPAVTEKMQQALPGIPMGWYADVMIPESATTDTLLYRSHDAYRHWPQCTRCGYNLTGNVSGVCPECGERI